MYYCSQDYFKVSGRHFIRPVPKSNATIVILGALIVISWFFRLVQYQQWEKAMNNMKNATFNNLSLKAGGTKETLSMYNRAVSVYEERISKSKCFYRKIQSIYLFIHVEY